MSSYFATEDRVSPGQALAASSTISFANGKPMDIKRIVLVTTTANAATKTITFGVRNVDDTSSVTKGTAVVPISALNNVIKAEVAGTYPNPIVNAGEVSQPTTVTTGRVLGYQTNLPGSIQVNPGQEFFVTSDAGTGVFAAYIEYQEEGNNPQRFVPLVAAVTLS